MKGLTRSFTTLGGLAVAGALIWFVPHYDRWSTGGYWAGMATFALAGVAVGAADGATLEAVVGAALGEAVAAVPEQAAAIAAARARAARPFTVCMDDLLLRCRVEV